MASAKLQVAKFGFILPDVDPADTGENFGIHLQWVKEMSMYRIFCECMNFVHDVGGFVTVYSV
jgi:hypothetical protein